MITVIFTFPTEIKALFEQFFVDESFNERLHTLNEGIKLKDSEKCLAAIDEIYCIYSEIKEDSEFTQLLHTIGVDGYKKTDHFFDDIYNPIMMLEFAIIQEGIEESEKQENFFPTAKDIDLDAMYINGNAVKTEINNTDEVRFIFQ